MTQRFQLAHSVKAALVGAAMLLVVPFTQASEIETSGSSPRPAQLGDFALKVEPGVALPLTHPQSQIFKVGGGQTIKALWLVNGYMDVGPSVSFTALPTESALGDFGTAWTFGGSLRIKRPHDVPARNALYASSPWLDADAFYVRTGGLNRPGFAVGTGLSVPIGAARIFWVGPFVRYLQFMQQPIRTGFDNHDAKILILGVSLEVGTGIQRPPEAIAAAEVRTIEKETFVCPDRDNDGIPDNVDHCPDVAGPMDNWGCPQYRKLVVGRDKLELKERIQFAWDQAILQEESFPVLDEVVQALKDNKGFRVQVEGHTSSEGSDDHNQTLSEKRAEAVLDYLVAHGIGKERLVSTGFASLVPVDSNATVAGRENNRRVEFVVHFIILNDGSK
jgi:outer membrane protein OmpA-like peptidoglycan-associated protein